MKTFRNTFFSNIVFAILMIVILSGCNDKMSEGQQRRKYEFLYKLSNYASLFREYTGGITYPADLSFYDNRMDKLKDDVSRMQPIEGYPISETLKDKFLITINENVLSSDTLRQKNLPEKENIRNQFDVVQMNDKVDDFMKNLYDEISVVGKE